MLSVSENRASLSRELLIDEKSEKESLLDFPEGTLCDRSSTGFAGGAAGLYRFFHSATLR